MQANDMLIMPASTIIETGNHIAHISDGTIRRKIALKFMIWSTDAHLAAYRVENVSLKRRRK